MWRLTCLVFVLLLVKELSFSGLGKKEQHPSFIWPGYITLHPMRDCNICAVETPSRQTSCFDRKRTDAGIASNGRIGGGDCFWRVGLGFQGLVGGASPACGNECGKKAALPYVR